MTALTVADLRAGDPAAFRVAADRWLALAAELDAAYEQFLSGQRIVDEGAAAGAAATAVRRRMRAQGRELSALVLPARRLAQALAAHADELAVLRHHAEVLLATAPALAAGERGGSGGGVGGSGGVVGGVGRELAEILARADQLDQATSRGIRSAVPGPRRHGVCVSHPGRDAVRQQAGRPPAEVFAWWQGLTPQQQEWVLADHADLVGGLDGIPAADRDRANRHHLDQLVAQAAPPPALVRLRDRLAGTDEAYLLLVDAAGDGRVVVALGNPDHARHTAVFVPGVGTDLQDIDGDLARAAQVRRTADATTVAEGDVSVIYWLGYDPPDSLLDGWREDASRRGGATLAPFVDGLRVTHAPGMTGHHLTALGHSYGSTVIAEAARQARLGVDDIVVVGSPGLHSDHASDLNLDPRHVWVGRADGDEIRFAPGPIHGPEPADPGYGANRFTTDTSGHGGYWRPDSGSLLNQAYIVTGQYQRVTLEHGSPPA